MSAWSNAYGLSQSPGLQQPWNMGIQVQIPGIGEGSQQQTAAAGSSSLIMSPCGSQPSAFCAAEKYMGLQQMDCQLQNPTLCSGYNESCDSLPSFCALGKRFSFEKVAEPGYSRCFGSTSQPQGRIKPQVYSNQCYTSGEDLSRVQLGNMERIKLCSADHDNGSTDGSLLSVHQKACCSSYHSSFPAQPHPSLSHYPSGSAPVSGNSTSSGAALTSKARMRWTQDLHEKFAECVNRLGGAEKATPKAILKLMDTERLSIFHVKSHLQKYRSAKYMPESTEVKSDKRTRADDSPNIAAKSSSRGLQIGEALKLQLDVQRHLHEQIEIQRNLQLRIEEQGRQLMLMFEQHQEASQKQLNVRDERRGSCT